MGKIAACSAYVERSAFCANGFPQTPACRPMRCHGCQRFSDALAWCQREDIPERWLRPSGLPFIGIAALSTPPGQGEVVPVADQLMEIRGQLVEQRHDAAAEAIGIAVACLLAHPATGEREVGS